MDVFIEKVRDKQCLWNLRHADYHNRNKIKKPWEDVEKECGFEGEKNEDASEFLELEKIKLMLLENDKNMEDDDYHYLMSFKKYMKDMDERKKLKLRMKIQEVLYDVMYGEHNQYSGRKTACSTATSFIDSASHIPINIEHDLNTLFHSTDEVPQTQHNYHQM
ncbi:uncharacterized protein [Eurosta solidaginis]|uniref:uncharacterized protein n=1 Tax=Eurosta solidaginis TaxID=178769 RepID=UPI00353138DE